MCVVVVVLRVCVYVVVLCCVVVVVFVCVCVVVLCVCVRGGGGASRPWKPLTDTNTAVLIENHTTLRQLADDVIQGIKQRTFRIWTMYASH